MKTNFFTTISFFFITIALCTTSALAHKVRVFAYEDSGKIITEAKFNNGRPAKNSSIIVTDNTSHTILLQGSTNSEGMFHFDIPEQAKTNRLDLNITVDVGEGHKGSWLLNSSEYLEGAADSPAAPPLPPPAVHQSTPIGNTDYNEIKHIVEEVIKKELAPIKRMLAKSEQTKLTLQDILGGLGYIFGLAGIAAYFQAKKHKEQ